MGACKGIVLEIWDTTGPQTEMRGGGGLGGGGGRDFPFSAAKSLVITVAAFFVRSCCVLRKVGFIKDKALVLSPLEALGLLSVSERFRFPVGLQV